MQHKRASSADWASLPSDLIYRMGDCLFASDDIDCYMEMRAVCHTWRSAMAKPCSLGSGADLRFRPRHWIMLDEASKSDDDTRLFAFDLETRGYDEESSDAVWCASPTGRTSTVKYLHQEPFFLVSMVPHAGHVYMVDLKGSVMKCVGTGSHCYAELVAKSKGGWIDIFLVESDGELLLIRRLGRAMETFRVDVERKVLEPVMSIGCRALFLGHRCLSVDADKFPCIQRNSIHYTTSQIYYPDDDDGDTQLGGVYRYDLDIGSDERISAGLMDDDESYIVRPLSLADVLLAYCQVLPYVQPKVESKWDTFFRM